MDLDEMKKSWQENILLKEKLTVSDSKIRHILHKQSITAIEKLIRYAVFYICASLPLGILFCLCSFRFFQVGWPYMIVPLFFLFLCVFVVLPSEIYLYRLLKRIDFSCMTLREVFSIILKYQKIIQKWEQYGIVFFVVFMMIWMFSFYKLTFGDEILWGFIIYMFILFLGGIVAIPLLYKKLYYKNINKVKESINELEEFENAD